MSVCAPISQGHRHRATGIQARITVAVILPRQMRDPEKFFAAGLLQRGFQPEPRHGKCLHARVLVLL